MLLLRHRMAAAVTLVSFDKENREQRRHRYLRRAAKARSLAQRARPGLGEDYLAVAQSWEALARAVRNDGTVHRTTRSTIYVVDDDSGVCNGLRRFLGLYGFTVQDYASGNAFLLDWKSSAGCLVLDYELPRVNGMEIMKQARLQGCFLPIIIMTGNPEGPLEEQAIRAGAWAFLRKPIDPNALLAVIESAIFPQKEAS